MKKPFFSLILLLPTALLIGLLLPFVSNLISFHSVSQEKVLSELEIYLNSRSLEGKVEVKSFDKKESDTLAYVFGGSSVVLNHPSEKKGEVFPKFLQDLWNESQVINLGKEGVDSFYIKALFDLVINEKPEMIILYAGHNDYTNAYRHVVRPHFSLLKGTLVSWLVSKMDRYKDNPSWHLDYNFEPKAYKLYARLGLLSPDAGLYDKVDQFILEGFKKNVLSLVKVCKEKGVKLLLVTPISNLHIEPSTGSAALKEFYNAKKLPYADRMETLKKLRDTDFFAPDIRAKQALTRALEDMQDSEQGIFTLTLEKALEKEEFEFGYEAIYDYFHFRREFHKKVAQILFKKLKDIK